MVAVRTRSRHARQKVSDGNPRSGADRGGRANKARPRRPRRETVAPLSALVGSRAVEEDLRLRQRVTSISAGVGAPRRMASERPRRSRAADRLFWLFSRSCGGGDEGQFAVFGNWRSDMSERKSNLCRERRRSHASRNETLLRNHSPFAFGFDRQFAKFESRVSCVTTSRSSRTRAAVEPSCATRETRAVVAVRKRG